MGGGLMAVCKDRRAIANGGGWVCHDGCAGKDWRVVVKPIFMRSGLPRRRARRSWQTAARPTTFGHGRTRRFIRGF